MVSAPLVCRAMFKWCFLLHCQVICIGMNYRDHCEEQGAPVPTEPVVFNKFASSIVGPFDPIPYPEVTKVIDRTLLLLDPGLEVSPKSSASVPVSVTCVISLAFPGIVHVFYLEISLVLIVRKSDRLTLAPLTNANDFQARLNFSRQNSLFANDIGAGLGGGAGAGGGPALPRRDRVLRRRPRLWLLRGARRQRQGLAAPTQRRTVAPGKDHGRVLPFG